MTDARRSILAIGPLPPPVNGLAVITAGMLSLLARHHDVSVQNVAPGSPSRNLRYHLERARKFSAAAGALVRGRRQPGQVLYLACDGGLGLLYSLALTVLARQLGYQTVLHHHTFAYADKSSLLMRLIMRFDGPGLAHIFLCQRMQDAFSRTYGPPTTGHVVSNACFVAPRPAASAGTAPGATLTIGLLSNLSQAKGLHLFVDLLREMRRRGNRVRGILAGPVAASEDAAFLEAAMDDLGDDLVHIGAVDGVRKDQFYDQVDVFVFPSRYRYEAQPTVLFEALSAGNLIVTFDRACMGDQIRGHGVALPPDADFVTGAAVFLEDLVTRPADLTARRNAAREAFARLHAAALGDALQPFADPFGPGLRPVREFAEATAGSAETP